MVGDPLEAQGLRLCLPVQGVGVWALDGELRSHMTHGQKKHQTLKKKKKQKQYSSKLTFKIIQIKKKK